MKQLSKPWPHSDAALLRFIPYAVFCDDLRQGADGTVTIDRIIDQIECVESSGPMFRRRGDLPVLQIKYAVCFKSAEPTAGLQAELRCTRPSGRQFVAGTKTLDLAGDYKGTFLSGEISLRPEETGWHIFDVLVDGLVKTRMVLNVSLQRQTIKEKPRVLGRQNAAPPAQKAFARPKCYARVLGNLQQRDFKRAFHKQEYPRGASPKRWFACRRNAMEWPRGYRGHSAGLSRREGSLSLRQRTTFGSGRPRGALL
jgi:hypothetical protein